MRAEWARRLATEKNTDAIAVEYSSILEEISSKARDGAYGVKYNIQFAENAEALIHLGYRLVKTKTNAGVLICWGPDIKFS